MDQLVFIGTGDAMGVPRVYCECEVCGEARSSGVNRRYRSLVSVEGEEGSFLIDCGPDWRTGMERRGQRFAERILVTHAHFDHIGGLPEWADACRWLNRRGQLYAPREVLDMIVRQYPWLGGNLDMHAADDGITLGGWQIRGWKVFHGKTGFRTRTASRKTASPGRTALIRSLCPRNSVPRCTVWICWCWARALPGRGRIFHQIGI
ncbi:hypothetical protein HMSSN036_90150 [Paenibacillus macerans]|nr:hypothetical protein HMSSN036_90150 [Paenibacillus macerans]